MNALLSHWTWDPFIAVAAALAVVHAVGIARLDRRASRQRRVRRRRQAFLFYLGLALLVLAVASPVDYWSGDYLWMHMVQHLLLMFAAPAAVVAGAPWIPLEHGVPVRIRRPVSRWMLLAPWAAPLRWMGRALLSPWTSVLGLNAAVVFWHLPAPFDLAEDNGAVHVWLMHGSFFGFGLLLFLQLVNSRPFRVRLSPQGQMAAIFATSVVFWVMAMAMALFSKGAWYPWYLHHEGHLLSPYADQQIAAGIMWVCGDFWAIPAMVRAVRRLVEERGLRTRPLPSGESSGRRRSVAPAGMRAERVGFRHSGPVHAEMELRAVLAQRAVSSPPEDR